MAGIVRKLGHSAEFLLELSRRYVGKLYRDRRLGNDVRQKSWIARHERWRKKVNSISQTCRQDIRKSEILWNFEGDFSEPLGYSGQDSSLRCVLPMDFKREYDLLWTYEFEEIASLNLDSTELGNWTPTDLHDDRSTAPK